MAYTTIPASTGGGAGTITTSAPLSGDGSAGTPATIANGAIALGKLATQADQTVLGNGSGGAASPVALTFTGLTATATVLKVNLSIGVSGGQSVFGGSATTESLTLRPNAADATTGKVYFNSTSSAWIAPNASLGAQMVIGGGASALSAITMYSADVNAAGNLVGYSVRQQALTSGSSADIVLQNSSGSVMTLRNYGAGYTVTGNIQPYGFGFLLTGGTVANMIFRVAGAAGDFVFETTTTPSERVRIPNAGGLVIGPAALATNATDGFLYIPTCAGTPSGTPTTRTGTVALVYDTTNHKFYIYDTAWKGGTAPGVWS